MQDFRAKFEELRGIEIARITRIKGLVWSEMVLWQKCVFQQDRKKLGRFWNILEGQRALKQEEVKDVWWKRLRK
jgi:hypothetical protein